MNDRSCCTRAAELDVPGEDVNIVAFNQGLVLDQALTQRDRVGVLALGGRSDRMYCHGVREDYEASFGTAAGRDCVLDLADE